MSSGKPTAPSLVSVNLDLPSVEVASVGLFSQVASDKKKERGSSCARGGLAWVLRKISSQESCQALLRAAQGNGGVSLDVFKSLVDVALVNMV